MCTRKVVLEPFSHFMGVDEGERTGLLDRVCRYYLRILNRMSVRVGCCIGCCVED